MTEYTYSAFSIKPHEQFNFSNTEKLSTALKRTYDQMTEYTCSAVSIQPAEQFHSFEPEEFTPWQRRDDHVTESTRPAFSVKPPEQFDFTKPEEFPIWKRRYDRYWNVSHLNQLSDADQIDYLCYIMGPKAEEILMSFKLTAAEKEDYALVSRKFAEYFVPKRNVVYERAFFNRRIQQLGESVAEFVDALQKLSETCEYGDLTDELIRDRIVVGLRDADVSYSLQLQRDLTLETAIRFAQQAEMVKGQLGGLNVRPAVESNVSAVNHYHKPSNISMPSNSRGAKNGQLMQSEPKDGKPKQEKCWRPTGESNVGAVNHYRKPSNIGMPLNSRGAKNAQPMQSEPKDGKPNQEKCWRPTYESNVGAVNHYRKPSNIGMPPNSKEAKNTQPMQSESKDENPKQEKCWRCGNICSHARRNCPARNATCSRCLKRYHFAEWCPFEPAEKSKDLPIDCRGQKALRELRKSLHKDNEIARENEP